MTDEEVLKYFTDAYEQIASYQLYAYPNSQIAVMGQAFGKAIELIKENAKLKKALAECAGY